MPQRKALWVFVPLAAFLLLVVLLFSGLGKDTEELPTALAGKPLPTMQLPSLLRAGQTVDNSAFLGRWTLLNVWATWCPTCYVEHPFLLELAAQGVAIIGLNSQDDTEKAKQYLAELGNPYIEVAVDESGKYGLDLGVYGAPETYLISPQGEVVLRRAGDINERVWRDRFLPVINAAATGEK